MINLVFIGPPGAGKGTVAARLAQEKSIVHISTGHIIREAIRSESDLGVQVKGIVEGGALIPDELTIELMRDRLKQSDAHNGFILDGFPRTIAQANALSTMGNIGSVINFVLENEEIIKRLSGRRVHKESGRTYHIEFNPPKVEGKDDITGDALITRPDDKEEVILNRLEVYRKQTEPLIAYYRNKNILKNLNCKPSPDTVFANLLALL